MAEYRNGPDSITLGEHYMRHVEAMTSEDLRSKSEIARELAWRDMQLAAMERVIAEYRDHLDNNSLEHPDSIRALDAIKGGEG